METQKIIVIFKEVGKDPIFMKAENNIESFQKILGGEIEIIPYEDIQIICKKERENLKPNIYLNANFEKLNLSIKGDLLITAKEENNFISLTRKQAIKYSDFLMKESFNYRHFDKNGKYLSNKQLRKQNNSNFKTDVKNKNNIKQENLESSLQMILKIQTSILIFLQENWKI